MNTVMRHLRSFLAHKHYTMSLTLPVHPQGLEKEVRIHPIVVGVKEPPMECDKL